MPNSPIRHSSSKDKRVRLYAMTCGWLSSDLSMMLAGLDGKGGAQYGQHGALCLETQLFPDSANKHELEGWPSPVLRPGEGYRHVMVHRFSVAAD